MLTTKQQWTREQLRGIPFLPPDKAGAFWGGVPHHRLLDLVERAAADRNVTLAGLRCHLNASGLTMVAAWAADLHTTAPPPGCHHSLAVLDSNNWTSSIRLYGGVVCDGAGVTLGRYQVARHSSGNIKNLPALLDDALQAYRVDAIAYPARVESLRAARVDRVTADRLVMAAGRGRLLPSSRLLEVAPAPEAVAAWDLVLSFARAAQKGPALKQLDNTLGLVQLVEDELR